MKNVAGLICFTGIDGSGKTTQARQLVNWLAEQGVDCYYVWSRGEVLSIRRVLLTLGRHVLGASSRQIESDQNVNRQYQARKSRFLKNTLIRYAWSTFTQIEHVFQINRDIRRKLRQGAVVVCDRYLWDSAIDMAVLNEKSINWFSGAWMRFLWKQVPQPAAIFLVDVSPEIALQRKTDIPSLDYLQKRHQFYQYLAGQHNFVRVDGSPAPALVQAHVRSVIQARGLIKEEK